MISHPDYDGHEAMLFAQDTASGLRALVAIHDTTRGPAFGGCRMYPYASEQHAMTDVLRLSRGMTYKAAICELHYGGRKSGIIADPRRDTQAATYGATVAAPEEIHTQQVDVFAPAALGAVLNDATIPCLRCRVVCGGANNQLAEARHDAALAVRGIVFVPDYLANAGGVIDFHQETIDDQPDAVLASVARLGAITRDVLRCAAATGATPVARRGRHRRGA